MFTPAKLGAEAGINCQSDAEELFRVACQSWCSVYGKAYSICISDATYNRNAHNVIIVTSRAQNESSSIQSKQVGDASKRDEDNLKRYHKGLT